MRRRSSGMLRNYGCRENMYHKLEKSSKSSNADCCPQPSSSREWLTATGRENDGSIATESSHTVTERLEENHVFWDMAPRRLESGYRRFGGNCCLHFMCNTAQTSYLKTSATILPLDRESEHRCIEYSEIQRLRLLRANRYGFLYSSSHTVLALPVIAEAVDLQRRKYVYWMSGPEHPTILGTLILRKGVGLHAYRHNNSSVFLFSSETSPLCRI
jgi:hypothetical protein